MRTRSVFKSSHLLIVILKIKKRMTKTSWSLLLISSLIVGLAACTSSANPPSFAQEDVAMNGDPSLNADAISSLPDFPMTDAKGNTVNLSSFKGKKVFVNLWATWCPPCRKELPSIEELYGKVGGNAAFVLLSLDRDFETARKFAVKNGLKTPIYYPAGQIPSIFYTQGIPTTFIFDENGKLLRRIDGSDNYSRKEYLNLLKK